MTESNPDVLVELQNVTYTHWNHKEPTLKNVSLKLRRGTLNVLVGPGGSGKSTLCDLFNGKIPHLLGGDLIGDVIVDGENTRDVEVKDLARKVGHVFQDPESMFATLYVEDEIAFGPENLRFAVEDIRRSVEDLLDLTQLTTKRHNLVWNLSGGQVQKLGLATALAMNPQLIVLDEPTSNLDPAATKNVHDLILTLRDKGMTVLLVTRELDEFLAKADQLLVLAGGCLVASGTPQEVLQGDGATLMNTLGIWLPETVEIGLALSRAGVDLGGKIPITVEDTLQALQKAGVLSGGLNGQEKNRETAVSGETLIAANNLSYSYGAGIYALEGISLDIQAGEMLAIVGRNGAGKSTLARLMVGLLKPQGELTLFGRHGNQWKIQDLATHIALVFQNPEHQFLTDRVVDEIGYSLMARGMKDPQEIQRLCAETLEQLDLQVVTESHPFALSAGMKRRLGVATMLVGNPQVLLVDEPTYGQDRQMTQTLMALMEDIRSRGVAVVMITHDMRLVQEYAQRVVVMSEGHILYNGSPHRLFEMEEVLDAANLRPTILHELLKMAQDAGVALTGSIQTTADFLEALQVPGSKAEVQ